MSAPGSALRSLQFDAADGSIGLGELTPRIGPGLRLDPARAGFGALPQQLRDLGNGYQWLQLGGLQLQGVAAGVALCFHGQALSMVSLGVQLPGAPMQEGWPTQAAIDAEVAFMRRALAKAFGSPLTSGRACFRWGEIWAVFDPKGFMASSGVRYGP
ncbi:hypothetical protein [Stenotrophomonas tuberculopleuritidis]|uniref:hypothetical protein n=1 Tax=Stenotrophomonas tuberculopleuritidis TaxID=3055079 RepID=UPI0026E52465|nr:hypothetical protein [Stenotrophomonas sp. 704A1]